MTAPPSDTILAEALFRVLETTPEAEYPRIIRGFVAVLRKRRLLPRAPRILRAFAEYAKTRDTRLRVEAAHPITLPNAMVTTQPQLLAGVRIQKGNSVVDASVRRRLVMLRNALRAA